jgi:hypothetical protein
VPIVNSTGNSCRRLVELEMAKRNHRTAQTGAALSENTPSPLSSVITIDLLWEFGGIWAVLA